MHISLNIIRLTETLRPVLKLQYLKLPFRRLFMPIIKDTWTPIGEIHTVIFVWPDFPLISPSTDFTTFHAKSLPLPACHLPPYMKYFQFPAFVTFVRDRNLFSSIAFYSFIYSPLSGNHMSNVFLEMTENICIWNCYFGFDDQLVFIALHTVYVAHILLDFDMHRWTIEKIF